MSTDCRTLKEDLHSPRMTSPPLTINSVTNLGSSQKMNEVIQEVPGQKRRKIKIRRYKRHAKEINPYLQDTIKDIFKRFSIKS